MDPKIVIRPFTWNDLIPLAKCYARGRIWADEPWNEWKKCPQCPTDKNNFGITFQGRTCPICGSKLIFFWNIESVSQDIQTQLSLPQTAGFLALKDDEIVGFTWGYPVEIKITISVSTLDLTIPVNSNLAPCLPSDEREFLKGYTVGYIDEVGVRPAFRGKGIGASLTWEIVEYFRSLDLSLAFLRTDIRAQSAISMYEKQWFKQDPLLIDPIYEHRHYWILNLKYGYYQIPRPHYEWERE